MELKVAVIGMKAFKGTVNGSAIDSATLYAVVRLDSRYNKREEGSWNHKEGHAVEEWKLPTADHAFRLAHLKPSITNPVMVALEIERVSNGTESKEMVVDCRPVERSANTAPDPLTAKPAAAPVRAAA